jgi:hypothetical protein
MANEKTPKTPVFIVATIVTSIDAIKNITVDNY